MQSTSFLKTEQRVLSDSEHITPPRPPLALRVGVVGHRPDRLAGADLSQLGAVIQKALKAVKEEVLSVHRDNKQFYSGESVVLRAISPLAEGSDRIFAEQALVLDAELCCVTPFPVTEYENDFKLGKNLEPDSLNRFRGLLARSTTRFELDGRRGEEAAAYGNAGRVVLNQSDLLVVVWDGERKGKRGGTEETFDAARARGVPVVWIDAHAPHAWQLLDARTSFSNVASGQRVSPVATQSFDLLRKSVREALEIPKIATSEDAHEKSGHKLEADDPKLNLQRFYRENQPPDNLAIVWKLFRDLVADGKIPTATFEVEPFEKAVEREWPNDRSSPLAGLVDVLRPFYAWPDKLAVIYADRYRSAFILAFLLAAAAVGMALLPIGAQLPAHHWAETLCTGLELGAILVILALVVGGRQRKWHERWLDYRTAAELIRHLRLVAPLGGERPFPQIPAHFATYGQPASTWMAWYARAIERYLGLPSVLVDAKHLNSCLTDLIDALDEQFSYHESNAQRCHRIEERLHYCGLVLIGLTLFCCGVHFVPALWHGLELPPRLLAAMTFFGGFFPALGAGLAGIFNQGEFRRIAKRSQAMRGQLRINLERLERLRSEISSTSNQVTEQISPKLAALAGDSARLLVNEVLDWRVVLLDQPLKPPA